VINKQIKGKIDQRQGVFKLHRDIDSERQQALDGWTKAVGSIWDTAYNGDGYRPEDLSAFLGASSGFDAPTAPAEGREVRPGTARGKGEGPSGSRVPNDKGKKAKNTVRPGRV
jgi:hypothetical protein